MTRKSKHKEGELIRLHWEYKVEAYYIKGHIDFDEAKATVLQEDDGYDLIDPRHKYARYECHGNSEYGHCLVEYDTPGRGRFKITSFNVKEGL